MSLRNFTTAAVLALALFSIAHTASAKDTSFSNNVVKIGVLTDLTGVYEGISGPAAVTAVKMAVKDFGGSVDGVPIRVVSGDEHDSPAVASTIARRWIDADHVDMIIDLTGSATALAVQKVAASKHTITIMTGVSTDSVTNEACTPYNIQYSHDSGMLANVTASQIVKLGGKTWFFIAANYAFGHNMVKVASNAIHKAGGKVLGVVYAPLGTADFASYVIQAKSSGAQVIGLANAGSDEVNTIKTLKQFNVIGDDSKQSVAALLFFIDGVRAVGVKTAQGMILTVPFYWNANSAIRAWSERFFKHVHEMPSTIQAADYSATMDYLGAVKATGTDNSGKVIQEMKETPIHDFFAKNGHIRQDGLMVHDVYLVKVKKPSEVKGPWDLLDVLATVPGNKAYLPKSESTCGLEHQ